MIENIPTVEEQKKAEILSETARIQWSELQRFFANGSAIYVAEGQDLIDVAYKVASDNKAVVESLLAEGKMGPVQDQQAVEWLDSDQTMWAAVVKPWVLVQPIGDESSADENREAEPEA